MADEDHYTQAADGLEAAAKALRACGQEEADEDKDLERPTPREKQPTDLKDAAVRVREHYRAMRRKNAEAANPPAK